MQGLLTRLPDSVRQTLPVVAFLALLVAGGVVHGLWTNRWGGNRDLEEAAARLERVPHVIRDWKGRDVPLDATQLARAEAAGHLRRLYQNGSSGKTVSTVVLCGRFGPLSVHTPDLCYGGAGYEIHGSPLRLEVRCADGSTAEVWTARFRKPTAPGEPPLRVCWTWSAGKGWLAPKWPRWTFRMEPVLHKLYVAREMTRLNEPLNNDPCLDFLREWLPRLDAELFSADGSAPVRGT